jgi:hypothetical protein
MLFYSVLDDKDKTTVDLVRRWLVEDILFTERCFYWASQETVRLQWKLLVENVAQFFLVNKVLEFERNTICAKELMETTKLDRNMWRYVSSARVMLTPLWMCGARLTYLFGMTPEEEHRIQNIINAQKETAWHDGARQIFDFFVNRVAHGLERTLPSMSNAESVVRILETVATHLCNAFASLRDTNAFKECQSFSKAALQKISTVLVDRFVVMRPKLEPFVVEDNFSPLFFH